MIFGERNLQQKCVNYDKQISRQNSVNRDLLGQANNNYTLSVKAHLVCLKVKNAHKLYKVILHTV